MERKCVKIFICRIVTRRQHTFTDMCYRISIIKDNEYGSSTCYFNELLCFILSLRNLFFQNIYHFRRPSLTDAIVLWIKPKSSYNLNIDLRTLQIHSYLTIMIFLYQWNSYLFHYHNITAPLHSIYHLIVILPHQYIQNILDTSHSYLPVAITSHSRREITI